KCGLEGIYWIKVTSTPVCQHIIRPELVLFRKSFGKREYVASSIYFSLGKVRLNKCHIASFQMGGIAARSNRNCTKVPSPPTVGNFSRYIWSDLSNN
ncbi:MAG TPA: hypothetical protein VF614_13385, partial [Chthoniobacteraceae bacterium]